MDIALTDILVDEKVLALVDKATPEYAEFAESVRKHGVMRPIMVSPLGDKYKLVTGLYRFVVSMEVGTGTIPAEVRVMSDAEIKEMQLIACTHRVETKPAEYAAALRRMLKHHPIEEIAQKINKPVEWIEEKLKD